MRDPREALSAVLAEQSPDDDDLRDWLTDRAAFVLDALEAEGYRIVGEGQACIGGEVVTLGTAPVARIEAGDDGQERITLRVPPGTWDRLGRPLGESGSIAYVNGEA